MARVEINYPDKDKITNKVIHDVYILDASGSMGNPEYTGDKAYYALQGCLENVNDNNHLKTICVFSGSREIYFPYIKTNTIITENKLRKYWSHGMTALNDAIMETLSKFDNISTDNVVNVKIFTDGGENDSKKYRYLNKEVSEKIQECEVKGWTISFIGTEYDVQKAMLRYSIDESNTLVHDNTGEGFKKAMNTTRSAMKTFKSRVSRGLDTTYGFYKQL